MTVYFAQRRFAKLRARERGTRAPLTISLPIDMIRRIRSDVKARDCVMAWYVEKLLTLGLESMTRTYEIRVERTVKEFATVRIDAANHRDAAFKAASVEHVWEPISTETKVAEVKVANGPAR